MIRIIKRAEIIVAEKLGDFVILKTKLYTGEKIKAKINPKRIYNKIGFKTKKDNTRRAPIIIEVKIFFR